MSAHGHVGPGQAGRTGKERAEEADVTDCVRGVWLRGESVVRSFGCRKRRLRCIALEGKLSGPQISE